MMPNIIWVVLVTLNSDSGANLREFKSLKFWTIFGVASLDST